MDEAPVKEKKAKKTDEGQHQDADVRAALAEAQRRAEEAEQRLAEKEGAELKEKDPMSGPGTLCECTKIAKAEAWQLKSEARVNPRTRTEEMYTHPAPEGYAKREGPNNGYFVVKPEHADTAKYPLEDVVIPNCRSKYTTELYVFGPKAAQDKGDFKKDPPLLRRYLCEKHAKMFGAKTAEQLKREGKKVPK